MKCEHLNVCYLVKYKKDAIAFKAILVQSSNYNK